MSAASNAIESIDVAIRINFCLVADGRHPAVDYNAVWGKIDCLLDARSEVMRRGARAADQDERRERTVRFD